MMTASFYISIDTMLFNDLKYHWAEVRNQPDKPDKNAKLVKIDNHLLILLHKNNGRPNCMNQHKDDRKQPRYTMNIKSQSAGKLEHQARPPSVKDKTHPKENSMPNFEPALNAFAPYANRVKKKSQIDNDHSR